MNPGRQLPIMAPRQVLLGEVADIDRKTVRPRDIRGSAHYVGLENITGDGGFRDVGTAKGASIKSNKFLFTPEHVLYGKLRPYLVKIAAPDFGGVCSTDILPIRPKATLDRRYLWHFLRTPVMVAMANSSAVGINLPRLSPSALASFSIPLPSVDEQQRIAAVLDAAEALRIKRRRTLVVLEGLTRAIFHELFDFSNSSIWKTSPIADLADPAQGSIRTGPFGSQLLHEEFNDEGPVAVLGIDNVVNNRFEWGSKRFISAEKYEGLERYTVRPGDVLVTIMGTCGRAAVVPSDIPLAINTKHLCCISLNQDRYLPEFLWACLRFHPDVLKQLGATRGAVMPGLNMGLIKRAEVPVPPKDIQLEFVRRKVLVDEQLNTASTHLKQLDDLFASLQQRAFRGEL